MSLKIEQKEQIKTLIINCLRAKFQNYHPEPASMPFHCRLLGKDRMALYSLITPVGQAYMLDKYFFALSHRGTQSLEFRV